MLGRPWLWIAAAAVVSAARPAHAETELVELRYDAPASCPTRGEIEAAIRARTASVRFGVPGQRVLAIAISASGDGYRGTLAIDAAANAAEKQLSAERCDDLASAFALVAALAIDPAAAAAPQPRAPTATRWQLDAALAGMVDMGTGPVAMLGAILVAGADWRDAYRLELGAVVGRDAKTEESGQASFTWLALRPAACRRWRGRRRSVAGLGCGHAEVGVVRASGADIVNQRERTRLWLAAGAHGAAELALSSRMFAQLQLGLSVPLLRTRYLFAPAVAIHETPAVTGWMGLGVGMQFR